ncbi:hypothetical protein KFK09_028671 [Dendrobium nobile]|uniref:Uncharacterized protein n=1 Tax=Dendrobium nobile TaxID=94219 RepID=A0A8T3A3X5_DENNO|nr:hypothetical protein KFK09_028671 [Dendrobium nobile]
METSASNPTKKAICDPDGPGSESQSGQKDAGAGSGSGSGQTIKFARHTSNSSYISLSCDDIELSGDLSSVYSNSSVHVRPTPDNQPMDEPVEDQSIAVKAEELYVANCIFTGGFNSETRAHYIDKVTEFEVNYSQMAGSKSLSACAMPACDRKLMKDEQGNNTHPCACYFQICRNCYLDALNDIGNCPGCKEPYGPLHPHSELPNQKDRLLNLRRRRLLTFIRMVVLVMFLAWRIKHKNHNAFAFSWLLDQLPKFSLVNRATDLSVLKDRFEIPTPTNPTKKSNLPSIDIFVSTTNPEKEPPLVTANTILSILAANYPVEKLACYFSNDGDALLTFETVVEAASFASIWVLFYFKHRIQPRNPESYFALKRGPDKNKVFLDFDDDRHASDAREELNATHLHSENIEELMEHILKATWMVDVILMPPAKDTVFGTPRDESSGGNCGNILNLTKVDVLLPMLVYVSRDKRAGYDHNKKADAMNALLCTSTIMSNRPFILNLDCDHYIYNSQALREGVCFMNDRGGDRICCVQFPKRFEGIDPSDRYANHTAIANMFTNIRVSGWIMSDVHLTTYRSANSSALSSPTDLDVSVNDISILATTMRIPSSTTARELLREKKISTEPVAQQRTWCSRSVRLMGTVLRKWKNRVGWNYGSITKDVVTGYRMHNRSWRSIYCVTKCNAFRGTAPINLTIGSVEILFSRNNALLASLKIKFLQRMAYLNIDIYPFTYLFLVVYCFLLALSLFSGQFIEWWRNEQFWLIAGTSAYLVVVLQGILKVMAGIEISFTLTSKSVGDDNDDEFTDLYMVK